MITERLMAAGSWDVQLVEDTPRRLLEQISVERIGFAQLVVTSARLDPRQLGDSEMLGLSRYTGLYRAQEGDLRLSGPGLGILLGDEDGKGDIYEAARSVPNGWLTEWVNSLRPVALRPGTTWSPGGSYTGSFFLVNAREAFETLAGEFNRPVEWRVNPNLTFDVGDPTDPGMYGPPRTIILHGAGSGGRDLNLIGVQARSGITADLEDYTTKIIVEYEIEHDAATDNFLYHDWETTGQSGPAVTSESWTERAFATAQTPDAQVPYARPAGGPVVLDRLIQLDHDAGEDVDPQTQANMQLGRFNRPRREVTVDGGDYDIGHMSRVGSTVLLYAPPVLMDMANPTHFRGRVTYPVAQRLVGMTWPLRRGMGVYLRHARTSPPTWIDLTNFVDWDTGDVRLEVGELPRPSR